MATPVIVTQSGSGTSSQWVVFNQHVTPFCASVAVVASGAVNYTVNYTYDDPNVTESPSSVSPPVKWPLSALSGQSTTKDLGVTNNSGMTNPAYAVQITINSGTGTATMYVLQAGLKQS